MVDCSNICTYVAVYIRTVGVDKLGFLNAHVTQNMHAYSFGSCFGIVPVVVLHMFTLTSYEPVNCPAWLNGMLKVQSSILVTCL